MFISYAVGLGMGMVIGKSNVSKEDSSELRRIPLQPSDKAPPPAPSMSSEGTWKNY